MAEGRDSPNMSNSSEPDEDDPTAVTEVLPNLMVSAGNNPSSMDVGWIVLFRVTKAITNIKMTGVILCEKK